MNGKTLRERVWTFFDESEEWGAKVYQAGIYGLIAISILELFSEYGAFYMPFTLAQHHAIDLSIASLFAVDYTLRLWASPKRLPFALDVYNVIDIVATLPSFLILFTGYGQTTTTALRGLRFLRALRVLRLVRATRAIEKEFDEYYKYSRADEEFIYYKKLLGFYSKIGENVDATAREEIRSATKQIQQGTTRRLGAMSAVDEKKVFLLGFLEFTAQLEVALSRGDSTFNRRKIETLISELGTLVSAEHRVEKVFLPPSRSIPINVQMWRLLRRSFRNVLSTFAVALFVNLVLKVTGLYEMLDPVINNLLIIETGAGALIVFITSFNLSFTNTKRSETDSFLTEFSNLLEIYAERISEVIKEFEKDSKKRGDLYVKIDSCFEVIGFNVMNGVRKGNAYHLKFDTVILQSLDNIKHLMRPYVLPLDSRRRTYIGGIEDALFNQLSKFQIKATIRVPQIFDSLNSVIIRVAYFILIAIAPYSAIPRLFIINMFQRAFYVTASEVDNAVFNTSLATLPISERIMRRLCRISKVLSE